MYKLCTLWILLIMLATSFSESCINKPCQVKDIPGECKLYVSCDFAIEAEKKYNSNEVRKILYREKLNLVDVVCCPLGNKNGDSAIYFQQEPPTPPLTSAPLSTINRTIRPTPRTTRRPTIESTTILPPKHLCGQQGITSRIHGGDITSLNEFPWIVRILDPEVGYACSGTLITNRHVITAAHCVEGKLSSSMSVRLGEWDSTTDVDCRNNECSDPPVDRNVTEIIIHPSYNPLGDPKNDIAILVFDDPVQFTEFITPICLPTTGYVVGQDYTNGKMYVTAGWGVTEYGSVSSKKRKLSIKAVPYNVCRNILNLTETTDPFVICAGGVKNKDTCQGDSGGPLTAQVTEDNILTWHLFGITSSGSRYCGRAGLPGIYTRVSKYMAWIEGVLSR